MSSQLTPDFRISAKFLKELAAHPEDFYIQKSRSKMKFGRPQLNADLSEKKRITYAPIPYLKLKQREINSYLQKVALPKCMIGAIKGKNNIQNALLHKNASCFLTIDLKDFFNKIDNCQVNKALLNNGFSGNDAYIITKVCTANRCLPQGAPTSSTLANIVFAATAERIEKLCIERNIRFTVFVDDLTFSADYDFSSLTSEILEILISGGFSPNDKKIHYRHKSCEITGLIVKKGRIILEKEMRNNLSNPRVRSYTNYVNRYCATYQNQFD